MTTDLCVYQSLRKKYIAALLIEGVIHEGYKNEIFTGYHYIKEPKSEANVQIFNYYRPLDTELALEHGFEIPSFRIKDYKLKKNFDTTIQDYSIHDIMKISKEYIIPENNDYVIYDSLYEDLSYLTYQNRKMYVYFTNEKMNQMKENGFIFKTVQSVKTKKISGIFVYKTKILNINKSQKGCPVAAMVLMEVSPHKTEKVTLAIFEYLKNQKYVTCSGSLFGNLTDNTVRKRLSIVISGYQYLDFYNLHVHVENKASNINLLYF
jgi:hypothetical protein